MTQLLSLSAVAVLSLAVTRVLVGLALLLRRGRRPSGDTSEDAGASMNMSPAGSTGCGEGESS